MGWFPAFKNISAACFSQFLNNLNKLCFSFKKSLNAFLKLELSEETQI